MELEQNWYGFYWFGSYSEVIRYFVWYMNDIGNLEDGIDFDFFYY